MTADLEQYYEDRIKLLNMIRVLEQHYDRELELVRGRLNTGSQHREQLQRGLENAHFAIEDLDNDISQVRTCQGEILVSLGSAREGLEALEKDRTRHNHEIRLAYQVLNDYKELFTEILERLERLEAAKPHPCATVDDCNQPFVGNCDGCPHKDQLTDQIIRWLVAADGEDDA